jgi:hypothetical protein
VYRELGKHTFSRRGINRESKLGHCSLGRSVVATQPLSFIELTSQLSGPLQVSAIPHHQYRVPLLLVATRLKFLNEAALVEGNRRDCSLGEVQGHILQFISHNRKERRRLASANFNLIRSGYQKYILTFTSAFIASSKCLQRFNMPHVTNYSLFCLSLFAHLAN